MQLYNLQSKYALPKIYFKCTPAKREVVNRIVILDSNQLRLTDSIQMRGFHVLNC